MSEPSLVIVADEITKDFGTTRALESVSVTFNAGEVHGIIGENGAGKSTLMKIMAGIERPSSGRLFVKDVARSLSSVAAAERLGIVMIHQELNLVDELSVADNIYLGREKMRGLIVDRIESEIEAAKILDRLATQIPPRAKVKTLSIAQKQMVEIAKALARDAQVLIMDEPTAVLTYNETEAFFEVIKQLRKDGVAVIYISHILSEIKEICDRVTVLRDGQVVASIEPAQMPNTTEQQLANLMVGRTLSQHFPEKIRLSGEMVLQVHRLFVPGRVFGASFAVGRGEILGFAGLIGAGRTELVEAVAGLRRASDGVIAVDGKPLKIRRPRRAVRAGMAYLSEDRKGTGLIQDMGIVENTTLVSLRRYANLIINRRAETKATRGHVEKLRIKADNLRAPISTLSGGNQQKVLVAKWLETNPKLLIVDEPTRGVDVGAKEEIYRLIRELTMGGMGCILISSEMNEILGMADRIAVMRGGRIVANLDGATATEEIIMRHAAGVSVTGSAVKE